MTGKANGTATADRRSQISAAEQRSLGLRAWRLLRTRELVERDERARRMPSKQRNDEDRIPRRLRLPHLWRLGLPAGGLCSADRRTLTRATRLQRSAGLAHPRGGTAPAR